MRIKIFDMKTFYLIFLGNRLGAFFPMILNLFYFSFLLFTLVRYPVASLPSTRGIKTIFFPLENTLLCKLLERR